MKIRNALLVTMIVCLSTLSFQATLYASEDYCPDNRPKNWLSNWGKWGPNDEIGTLNYITPNV
ncbi:MAG: hypothetical protein V3S89_12850, partial [Desulfobacterales bacterium]